uniref:Ig-like domain-containing protein n=1 Tax=Pygocentrus nattereri TaxID=42514 RepID=A0AAR2K6V1_PYGNA
MWMLLTFYLLFIGLHVSKGCTLVNSGRTLDITAYTGGSVLLPCYCTDSTAPEHFIWKYMTMGKVINIDSDQHRVQLYNGHSPGNLSLLLSNLTEEDGGWYRCDAKMSGYIDIMLTVKGCPLLNNGTIMEITVHTGGSVLLPCYCTDPHTTPETFSWNKHNQIRSRWEVISSESGQYRDRVQLFNGHSPGNLSLLISHLTEEDGGDYRCDIKGSGYTDIRLTVTGKTLFGPALKKYHSSF